MLPGPDKAICQAVLDKQSFNFDFLSQICICFCLYRYDDKLFLWYHFSRALNDCAVQCALAFLFYSHISIVSIHTGYPETTNATDNNKHS